MGANNVRNPAGRLRHVVHLDLGCEFRGGQRQVLYLALQQQRAGTNVHIAAPAGSPVLRQASLQKIPTLPLPGRYDFDPRNAFVLNGRLEAGSIVHTHDARAASLGAMVRLMRRDVYLVHTRRVSYALGRGWSRWKYALGQIVVCVSREVEAEVRKAGVSRTDIIASAIVLDRYKKRQPGNMGRIGIIGALSPQKGHAQLLKALSRLGEIPEVWIVGSGELESPLRDLASTLGIAERIVWKGQVESPEILPFLDVVVVPSAHGEGSSGVIKEAWAAQVPIICSDLPANLELVRHEKNGLIFANNDPAELANQLRRVFTSPALVASMVAAGSADVLSHDVAFMHTAYDRLYQRLR